MALCQARAMRDALRLAHPGLELEIRVIKTTGDRILDAPLAEIGDKGLFTGEIEQQLLDGAIDLAVHSHKDLPTQSPEHLEIAAIPARQDPADVLISKDNLTLDQLPAGATVLTGSLRRAAQLRHLRADLNLQDLRGNIHTRLEKLEQSDAAGLIMSAAALVRLDLEDRISERLEPERFLPACGQGALALQIRSDNQRTAELLASLDDAATRTTVTAERALLAYLEGGCQIPIGAHAVIRDDRLYLRGMIASLDGSKFVADQASGKPQAPAKLGTELAQKLLDQGGKQILDAIRSEAC